MSEQESMVAALAETVASALPAAQGPAIAAALNEQVEAAADVPATDAPGTDDNAEGAADPERKRRRRRSRRGRRNQDEQPRRGSDDKGAAQELLAAGADAAPPTTDTRIVGKVCLCKCR